MFTFSTVKNVFGKINKNIFLNKSSLSTYQASCLIND